MSKLYIFDKYDNLLTTLSNDSEKACPFWDAPYEEELNTSETFEFTIPGDHEDAIHVVPGNQVAFKDRDGDFRLFWIRELDEAYEDSIEKRWICEAGFLENNGESVEDIRAYDTTAEDALTRVLGDARWKVGNVAELGINSATFYFISATKSIETIINTWGGELKTRITVDGNKITGRYIDILPRRGADTGKRWVAGKDIAKHRRTILHYPVTALIGRGKGVESGDGYSRRITFEDVEWKVSNGDPVDKPLGQIWVGDPDALQLYGIPNADGSLRHIKGWYDDSDEEDAANLLHSTWDDLQRRNKPIEQYDLNVILLEKLTGYEHEKVRLGDTTYAINRKFKPEIVTEQRVVRFKYYIDDPSDERAEVTLGDVIPLFTDDDRLDRVEAKLNDNSGIWSAPVTDTDFPDTVPPVPTNFTAQGLYKTIALDWEYDPSSYISSYEVYASQIAGFSPDASNLVFRGKTGGHVFNATENQQWYFRLRAVNTHGTAGPFTAEIIANTVNIVPEDFESSRIPEFIDMGIIRQATQPVGTDFVVGQLWIDTSVNPNVWKRWNGGTWDKLGVTTPGEIGAYTKDEVDQQLSNYVNATVYSQEMADLQAQIDNQITSHFYAYEPSLTNLPASDWTTIDEKNKHIGDLFYNTDTGYSYRFALDNGVYKWVLVRDEGIAKALQDAANAQDTADSKRRVFISQPTTPYDAGDLWDNGGAVYRSTVTKTSAATFSAADWILIGDVTSNNTSKDTQNVGGTPASTVLSDIAAKADLTYVNGQLISKANAADVYTITEVDNALNSKVSTTTYSADMDGVVTRLDSAESRITQTETDITTKVSNTTYQQEKTAMQGDISSLETRMGTAETSITENANEIALRAKSTDVYTKTEVNNSLAGKADNSTVSAIETRVTNNEAAIQVNANEIALRVTKSTYDIDVGDLQSRMTTAESSITQNAENIELKVSKNGVISSINQTAESVKISAAKVSIDGDLTVTNGLVRIKDGIITNELLAGGISADKLAVAKLSAITADLGTVKSGILESVIIRALSTLESPIIKFGANGAIGELTFLDENGVEVGYMTRGLYSFDGIIKSGIGYPLQVETETSFGGYTVTLRNSIRMDIGEVVYETYIDDQGEGLRTPTWKDTYGEAEHHFKGGNVLIDNDLFIQNNLAWHNGEVITGSNADGDYIRFPNGIQMTWSNISIATSTASETTKTLPASFAETPSTFATLTGPSASNTFGIKYLYSIGVGNSQYKVRISIDEGSNSSNAYYIKILAIGRWK